MLHIFIPTRHTKRKSLYVLYSSRRQPFQPRSDHAQPLLVHLGRIFDKLLWEFAQESYAGLGADERGVGGGGAPQGGEAEGPVLS